MRHVNEFLYCMYQRLNPGALRKFYAKIDQQESHSPSKNPLYNRSRDRN